jgi:pilus assembly protein CpaB
MARAQEMRLAGGGRGFLLIALLAGAVAAVLVFIAVASSGDDDGETTSAPSADTVPVVVAAQGIGAGTTITAEMLKVVNVPADVAVRGALSDTTLLVGQTTAVALAEGEAVLTSKVGSPIEGEGLGYVVPAGKRAVGISIDEQTAAGGHLLPGDHVDVVATSEDPLSGGTTVRIVLQDIEVLAVSGEALEPKPVAAGGEVEGAATGLSGNLPEDPEENPDAETVTVAVDPSQAQILVGLQAGGANVWLLLRNAGDQQIVELGPTTVVGVGP